jgi:L-iditol 2-dehydrogenase
MEPFLVSPVGASGGFESDGRPSTYRSAMRHLARGKARVAPLITDPCDLRNLPQIFSHEYSRDDFIKAVLLSES